MPRGRPNEVFKGLNKLKNLSLRGNWSKSAALEFDDKNVLGHLLSGNHIAILRVSDFTKLKKLNEPHQ